MDEKIKNIVRIKAVRRHCACNMLRCDICGINRYTCTDDLIGLIEYNNGNIWYNQIGENIVQTHTLYSN